MHSERAGRVRRGYLSSPPHFENIGCIRNLFATSELAGRRNAGWLEVSAFLGSFPEMPKGSRRVPGPKFFKQVFAVAEHYYDLSVLREVAVTEMPSHPWTGACHQGPS